MPKKQKILVTGGAGFIGREVVKELLSQGYFVRVVDDLSKKTVENVNKQVEFIKGDLSKRKTAVDVMDGMDYCIHLAAKIGGIGYFHKFPATILSDNNKMYSTVFEAAVETKIQRLIYISSSMVFESTTSFPSKESDLPLIPPPVSAYGFSKLIGEQYCKAFSDQYGLKYTIIRPFNAYGINEKPEQEVGYAHVIPDLVRKIIQGQYPLEILGNGNQTRCYTHVSDIAKGIVMAMQSKKAVNEDFNISTEEETKVIDLAETIWNLCDMDKPFKVKNVDTFKYDIQRRVPSNAKAKELLGWKPQVPLNSGLPEVVDWVKNFLNTHNS
jgi:nucleoside-diphosphate-sugar epimerase